MFNATADRQSIISGVRGCLIISSVGSHSRRLFPWPPVPTSHWFHQHLPLRGRGTIAKPINTFWQELSQIYDLLFCCSAIAPRIPTAARAQHRYDPSLSTRIHVRRTSIAQCRQSSHYHNIYVSMKLTVYVHVRLSVFARFSGRVVRCFSPFNGILRSKWYRTPNSHCDFTISNIYIST